MIENPHRRLPSVHQVLEDPAAAALVERYGRGAVKEAVRSELDHRRQSPPPSADGQADLLDAVALRLHAQDFHGIRRVINATGVILHTNLGRAPLARTAADAAREAAAGYVNLEIDLTTGQRANRQEPCRDLIRRLLGCESATVVNNCAAATVLTLHALAACREVVVSRGQLVEIGGGFRIPEVMTASGAILREVGTTNITRAADFEAAISERTAAILRVHPSNFRIHGHAAAPDIAELAAIGRAHGLPVIDDIGSGALVDFAQFDLGGEPRPAESLAAGADLVLFSGDKLLGGPQTGIIAGRQELIEKIERDPLMRAFRLDKMCLAALEATLRLYLKADETFAAVPVLQLLSVSVDELHRRAETIAQELPNEWGATVRDDVTFVGGGSLPDQTLPTVVIAMRHPAGDAEFARRLRCGDPAVLPRVKAGEVVIDLRSVPAADDTRLMAALGGIDSAL